MKILLINPPVCNDIGYVLTNTPPLGLLYLASFLEKKGYKEVKVIDADVAELSWNELKKILIKEQADIVGVTGPSFIMPALLKTVKIIRQSLPNCFIVAGGFAANKEPEKLLREAEQAVNFIVIGEGEFTLLDLVNKVKDCKRNNKGIIKDDFKNIPGLVYLDSKGELYYTSDRGYIKDLDVLPWPAYHLLNVEFSDYSGMHAKYKEMGRPVATMVTSRGCPHRCAFCSLGSKMYRERDIKDTVNEIEFYQDNFKVKSVQFYDDEFIGLGFKQNSRIETLCQEIIDRGLHKKLNFLVQGRCSHFIQLSTLQKMKQAGFVWIWWGAESGSQKILDSINKDIKVENIIRDVSLARQAGLKSMLFIMVGFPKETLTDIKLTTKLIKQTKADQVRIHIVTPYPGSELRKYFEEHNLLEKTDYYKFDTRKNVIHHTEEMSAEEIKKYYRLLVFRFENGYWYFIKFLARSLITLKGYKKLLKRLRMIFEYIIGWFRVAKS